MQAKLAEINSSGMITKTKKPTLLASFCWAFHENRDTERNALRSVSQGCCNENENQGFDSRMTTRGLIFNLNATA